MDQQKKHPGAKQGLLVGSIVKTHVFENEDAADEFCTALVKQCQLISGGSYSLVGVGYGVVTGWNVIYVEYKVTDKGNKTKTCPNWRKPLQ